MAKTARFPSSLSAFISEQDRAWVDMIAEDEEASISEVVRATIKIASQHQDAVVRELQR